jgi:hypothetical protein
VAYATGLGVFHLNSGGEFTSEALRSKVEEGGSASDNTNAPRLMDCRTVGSLAVVPSGLRIHCGGNHQASNAVD